MGGKSHREAAAALGVSKSSIWRTMMRECIHNTQELFPRNGRPPLFDATNKRQLIREICRDPGKPWAHFARQFNCSAATVCKAANESGFSKRHKRSKPFLSPKAIAQKKAWAIANIGQDWKRVIYTDEASIELGLDIMQRWTIRRAGEEYLCQHLQKTFRSLRKTMMIWGAIAYGKKWDLVRLPLGTEEVQRVTQDAGIKPQKGRKPGKGLYGDRYVRWIINGPLKRCVKEQRRRRWRDILVLEDGALAHSCKQAQQAQKNRDIKNLIHPPSSPDLNPIENAWHLLKMKVSQLPVRATKLDQLWEQVQDCWRDIPIEFINRLIVRAMRMATRA
jgi:transposase